MENKLSSYISSIFQPQRSVTATISSISSESEPLLKKSPFCDSVDSMKILGMPTVDEGGINVDINVNENKKSNMLFSGDWIQRFIIKRKDENGSFTQNNDDVRINVDTNEGINGGEITSDRIREDTIEGNSDSRDGKWDMLKALLQLTCLFVVSTVVVYATLMFYLPPLDENQKQNLRIPKSIEDLQELNKILSEYMDQYNFNVMTTYSVVYIFLQTFSIPGSMWLSILGGALFGLPTSLLIVCMCSAIGASNCYLLSKNFGKSFVRKNFSTKLSTWSAQLRAQSHNLLNYMIVLRLMPFPPNWFANIAAPHVGVPLSVFFIGTLFGVAGPSIIHIQAGMTINQLTSADEFQIFSWTNVGALALIGVAVLVPVWIRRRSEKKEDVRRLESGGEYEEITGANEHGEMEFRDRRIYGTFAKLNSRSGSLQVS
ncbi:13634_t:CDS:2 [Acaulospora morrowiae]|uniref:13634_t:CDS:1 n=1 Tax=Acaulospora morrowiae TaxID=94023 RepID=A0A9N9E877_9GLOM|nr:13634_t:CDS:2 [Acaulospora morrowiae]